VKMGRTVVSYRQAIEGEIALWDGFRKALRADDAEAFDNMMNAVRVHASAGSMATRPILFEGLVMSILLEQEKTIIKLLERFDRIEKRLQQP
jgi:hypothetical protein